jgi:predicted DNA-binding transcriptional regulator YafY
MRRSDRLFQIVSYLQSRRMAVTAQQIAEEFDVSPRTVYRDIQDLITTGVPISGEAGVGYLMDKNHCLPPMVLDVGELETLMLGAAMVSSYTDAEMSASARSLIRKLKGVLNERDRDIFSGTALFAHTPSFLAPWTVDFSMLRRAIRNKNKVHISYKDEQGRASERTVRPLSMVFFGAVWLLVTWCELRKSHRNFRIDRMDSAELLDEEFVDTPETSLQAYLDCEGYIDGMN